MRVIYKYEVSARDGYVAVDIPANAEIVHVREQHHRTIVCFWALVDPNAVMVRRTFFVQGTGGQVPPYSRYLGTAMPSPDVVLHLFEVNP